ncbi:MAG: aconitate hydratase [Actinomycetota bacterium]|nr:aconitate hydratase [Actinomycetota bacterium]
MAENVAQKLISAHLVQGDMSPGAEIGIRIDQTLTQDATGTMVMLELEAMDLDHAHTELSAQYVDHNVLQTDFRNADDHLFLQSACKRFGLWFSKPGNGVSHPVHMQRFGAAGRTMVGSDSHTCAAGSLGMLAIGAGGLEVALAIAGEPFYLSMPEIWGVRLVGELQAWVSAKDVILEMLRRHGVDGGFGRIIEYHGPGLEELSAMDRHVIANMGAELGATTTVFPSDDETRSFLAYEEREHDWQEVRADPGATYDHEDEIDLSTLEPLIACPSSPGNVVPVREVAGREVYQVVIGSSANPGLRDFAVPAMMVRGRQTHENVSFDVNPTSRQILEALAAEGWLLDLIAAGTRLHQAGCNGCIGMGQAPATGKASLRTFPRNFPGRSGTKDDQVYLCSPETATAAALTGVITDPRDLGMEYPRYEPPQRSYVNTEMLVPPSEDGRDVPLEKGPNIVSLPEFDPLPELVMGPVLLKVGDDISTDEIMPAGARVLPYRSNIPAMADFAFEIVDETYPERARATGDHFVVGGDNYGQGSSREHAAIVPRYLGLRAVLAKSFARIHRQNLVNFAVLPLTFLDPGDYDRIQQGDVLGITEPAEQLRGSDPVEVRNETRGETYAMEHRLSARQVGIIVHGSLLSVIRDRQQSV